MKNKPQHQVKRFADLGATLIKHYFGAAPTKIEPLGGGLTNFVYTFTLARKEYVLRMSDNPATLSDFLKEQWAVGRAAAAGVPVPEILEVGQEVIGLPYMIQAKVPGTAALEQKDCADILKQMGQYTAQIHTIRTQGYGPTFNWSKNKLSQSSTWQQYLHNELQLSHRLQVLARYNMLPQPTLARLRRLLKTLENSTKKPVLQHGDMRLKNVMVDEKKNIVSIIDWDNAVSSIPPYWDLSIALHDLTIDEKLHFLDGYGIVQKTFRNIAPTIKAINLINYAPAVERIANRKDKEKLDHYRSRLQGALDLFAL